MNRLSLQDRARILGCLTEGMSLRATTRLCDVSINTVTRLLVDVGAACDLYQNETLRNLPCKRVQVDEIWSFCGMKEKNVPPKRRREFGRSDVYTWVAIDADTKLVPSWLVGQRDVACAKGFVSDLTSRMANRIQLSGDGHKVYLVAVENAFAGEVNYAMLVKLYSNSPGKTPDYKYRTGNSCGAIKGAVCGDPKDVHISTSFVERQNLTMRMGMRRFTRLTNGFSKKVENHAYAVALHYMHYNFGRIHKTLHVTPAMEAGIADHVWTLEEITKLAN